MSKKGFKYHRSNDTPPRSPLHPQQRSRLARGRIVNQMLPRTQSEERPFCTPCRCQSRRSVIPYQRRSRCQPICRRLNEASGGRAQTRHQRGRRGSLGDRAGRARPRAPSAAGSRPRCGGLSPRRDLRGEIALPFKTITPSISQI